MGRGVPHRGIFEAHFAVLGNLSVLAGPGLGISAALRDGWGELNLQ